MLINWPTVHLVGCGSRGDTLRSAGTVASLASNLRMAAIKGRIVVPMPGSSRSREVKEGLRVIVPRSNLSTRNLPAAIESSCRQMTSTNAE